jgi:putative FmdB family regulatory protein
MPLYEYQCHTCGQRFELIQKFSDPPVAQCPSCGADTVEKQISSPAIQFKGSGWYVTDYARKDQTAGKAEKADGAKEPGESAKESKESSKETKEARASDRKEGAAKPAAAHKGSTPEATPSSRASSSSAPPKA